MCQTVVTFTTTGCAFSTKTVTHSLSYPWTAKSFAVGGGTSNFKARRLLCWRTPPGLRLPELDLA